MAASIVRRIFRMTLGGYGPFQIAAQLSAEYIPILAYHQAQLGIELWQNREIKNPYKWQSSTIAHILQKHEYLGHLDKDRFAKEIQSHIEDRQTIDFTEQEKRIAVCEKRIRELEMLIAKIYEDNALEKLSDKRYTML